MGTPRLRVAFIDQTGASAGGAQESFALLVQHLPRWIEPHVVLFHDGEYAHRLRRYGLDVCVIPIAGALDGLARERFAAAGTLCAPRMIGALVRWLRERRIAIAYTHTVKAHFLGAPAARLARVPCVMHLRDILEGSARAALRTISATCSRERIAISQAVAQAYALPRTTVVFNPVDVCKFTALPSRAQACARFGIPFDRHALTVGMVGRINRWKGHDRFVRIAAALARKHDARFLIAGSPVFRDADFLPELERMAIDLGVRDRVHFIPWVDDVGAVYALLDVHCNCSSREPFGRSVIEAAAAGIPTVCFADAGAAEVLTDGLDGCIVQTGDEAAMAHAVGTLLSSRTYLRVLGDGARALAVRFDPSNHARQVSAVLERAAA